MGAADATDAFPAGKASPQADDATEALAQVDATMRIIDRWMPSCKFKVSCLHRLTLRAFRTGQVWGK